MQSIDNVWVTIALSRNGNLDYEFWNDDTCQMPMSRLHVQVFYIINRLYRLFGTVDFSDKNANKSTEE